MYASNTAFVWTPPLKKATPVCIGLEFEVACQQKNGG